MHYKQIIRSAPNGAIERPWRNRDRQFVLGNPKHGNVKHHDEFAVKVDCYGEALELVERGFSIRMSDGRNSASLVAPGSLTFVDAPVRSLDDLWNYTIPVPPFTKAAVLADLQKSLLAEAFTIACIANIEAARSFSGLDLEAEQSIEEWEAEWIDLSRFRITEIVDHAYDYAFGSDHNLVMSDEDVDELEVFLERASQAPTNRFMNPMHLEETPLRLTTEMAYARWQLREGSGLTVKRLAFLARMTENAVRNSLSKEKIKPEDGLVPFHLALRWLEGRQNFLPQREEERISTDATFRALHELRSKPISRAMTTIIDTFGDGGNIDNERLDKARTLAEEIMEAVNRKRQPASGVLRDFARTLGFLIDHFAIEAAAICKKTGSTAG